MSLDQFLNIRRPAAKPLMILVSSLSKSILMDTANQPARLGVGCRLVMNMEVISADTDSNSNQQTSQ